jgi:N-acetylglucosamine kinase-like BadF-type ATPase
VTDLGLCIEGGGSKTHFVLFRRDGTVVAREHCGPSSKLYLHTPAAMASFREALSRIAGVTSEGVVQYVGLAGPMDSAQIRALVENHFKNAEYVEAAEYEIALAMHGTNIGIGLVAGTGSSCSGRNERGETASCGGYGPQFDDDGSGYWIGREAVRAAVRAEDGRGPETMLASRFRQHVHVNDRWDIFRRTDSNGHLSVQEVASFTKHVFEAAKLGDPEAVRICAAAGKALAQLVLAVASKLRFDHAPIPLAPTGGVFHGGELVFAPLREALSRHPFHYDLLPAATDPIDGLLAMVKQQLQKRTK